MDNSNQSKLLGSFNFHNMKFVCARYSTIYYIFYILFLYCREVVGYVSNYLESFLNHNQNKLPDNMIHRLQLEYDQFFIRATNCILHSQK